jgi:hypothetical protein
MLGCSPEGEVRSSPAEKHLPLPERMTARTLVSSSILWNKAAACRISLRVSQHTRLSGEGDLLGGEGVESFGSIDFWG